jgi:hypothetical protein
MSKTWYAKNKDLFLLSFFSHFIYLVSKDALIVCVLSCLTDIPVWSWKIRFYSESTRPKMVIFWLKYQHWPISSSWMIYYRKSKFYESERRIRSPCVQTFGFVPCNNQQFRVSSPSKKFIVVKNWNLR